MSGFRTILFDLDGTLTDPRKGILNSFDHALKRMHITEKNRKEMISLIGPPLQHSFRYRYHLQGDAVDLAVAYYREYFGEKGLYENTMYHGIPELLSGLKHAGKKILLASTKADIYADRILTHFKIHDYFDYLSCAAFNGSRIDKGEIIAHALDGAGIVDKHQAVMVGDRKFDINGAKQNGIASIAVYYGFGTKEELKSVQPDYRVSSVAELSRLLL
jgi:phosphoglycolate phosphatase